jgi:hypothetical protein
MEHGTTFETLFECILWCDLTSFPALDFDLWTMLISFLYVVLKHLTTKFCNQILVYIFMHGNLLLTWLVNKTNEPN